MKSIKSIQIDKLPISSVILYDKRLAFISNMRILIYNLKNFKCELTLKLNGHTPSQIIQCKNGKLISKDDKIIVLWNIFKNTYKYEYFWHIHNCLQLEEVQDEKIAASIDDKKIIIFLSFKPYDIVSIITISYFSPTILFKSQWNDLLFCSHYYYKRMYCYELTTYTNLHYIEGVVSTTRDSIFETKKLKLVIGNDLKRITVINIQRLEIEEIYWYYGCGYICSFVLLDDGMFIGGTNKGNYVLINEYLTKIKTYSVKFNVKIQKLLHYNENTYISLGENFIQIWELSIKS